MDNIIVITLNTNDEQVKTVMTVNELIHAWYHEVDIPTNDDTVVSCVLNETQLYFETFGELMQALTGECQKGWLIYMRLHLFWLDKNWNKRGDCANNYNLVVDMENKTYKVYTNAFYGYYHPDDIEVKKKSDIEDYIEYLNKNGFTEMER